MTKYFRDEGFQSIASVANKLLSGVVLSGQGLGTTTYLLGASAHINTTLKENSDGGRIIAYLPAGNAEFPCTIPVSGQINIFHTANDACSLFYYIESGII